MCTRGHAYFRTYDAGSWYLACCQCPHRVLEGPAEQPSAPVIEIHLPEATEEAA